MRVPLSDKFDSIAIDKPDNNGGVFLGIVFVPSRVVVRGIQNVFAIANVFLVANRVAVFRDFRERMLASFGVMTKHGPMKLLAAVFAMTFLLVACDGAASMPTDGSLTDVFLVDVRGLDTRTADDGARLETSTPSDVSSADVFANDALREDVAMADAHTHDATDAPATPDAQLNDTSTADANPSSALGPVQCRVSADCGSGLTCATEVPGGVCNGCSVSCPSGTTCDGGTCRRDCRHNGDCNIGMYCTQGSRQCAARTCGASSACPSPYLCDLSRARCERPSCVNGNCPSPLVCVNAMCVEP